VTAAGELEDAGLASALRQASFLQSTAVERLMEHAFLSEILQAALAEGRGFVTVLRAETDTSGYDLVLGCGGVTRWVQLKASARETGRSQPLNIGLTEQPSGCVVWLVYAVDGCDRISFRYRWLGGPPGERLEQLPGGPARHTRANAQGLKAVRPAIRKVSYGAFTPVATTSVLLEKLFGPPIGTPELPRADDEPIMPPGG
jgi:hypothetical protein